MISNSQNELIGYRTMLNHLKAKDVPGAYDYYICGPDGGEGDGANRAFVECLLADSPLGKGATALFAKEMMYTAARRAGPTWLCPCF